MKNIKKILSKLYKSRLFDFVLVFGFIGICFAVGGSAAYIHHEDNPTDEAIAYFRSFIQSDFDNMYKYLDQDDGYINKQEYVNRMKLIRRSIPIDNYKIKDTVTKNGHKTVIIECRDEVEDDTQNFVIVFNAKRRGIQIIPDYKVNIDSLMIKNYKAVISKGDFLELNNERIPEDKVEITEDKNGNLVYTFDKIITGNYRVEASNKYGCQVKNEKIIKDNITTDVTGQTSIANDEYTEKITNVGNVVLNYFYKDVRKKIKKDKSIYKWFKNKKKAKKKIDKMLKKSNKIVLWPGTKNLKKYNVSYLKLNKTSQGIKFYKNKQTFRYTINYNYNYKSTIKTALYNSYVYKMSGKCKCQMILDFCLMNDRPVLIDIKLKNKNKKDKFYDGR